MLFYMRLQRNLLIVYDRKTVLYFAVGQLDERAILAWEQFFAPQGSDAKLSRTL